MNPIYFYLLRKQEKENNSGKAPSPEDPKAVRRFWVVLAVSVVAGSVAIYVLGYR